MKKLYLLFLPVTTLIIIIYLIIIQKPNYKNGIESLNDIQTIYNTIPQDVLNENTNIFFPSYENYYKKTYQDNFLRKLRKNSSYLACKLNLISYPAFSESYFINLLNKLIKSRSEMNLFSYSGQKITLGQNQKIVIFGNIQGAMHSFIRCLEELYNQNIITNDLHINKDYYIVIIGNVVNRTYCNLESLGIVAKLILNNKKNCFYLKNRNEYPHYWRQHTLKNEIDVRYNENERENIYSIVDDFFKTLPTALFFEFQELETNDLNFFKFIPIIEDEKIASLIMHDPTLTAFLLDNKTDLFGLESIKENESLQISKIVGTVSDFIKRKNYEKTDGLRLISPNFQSSVWLPLSSPSEAIQRALGFYNDAFSVIKNDNGIWKITLNYRDVRSVEKEFQKKSYDFITGKLIKD